jgi:hypothetical protein
MSNSEYSACWIVSENLLERIPHIKTEMRRLRSYFPLDNHFILDYDIQDIPEYLLDAVLENHLKEAWISRCNGFGHYDGTPPRILKKTEKSVWLKHVYAWATIARNPNGGFVFEDDITLHSIQKSHIDYFISYMPNGILFLGDAYTPALYENHGVFRRIRWDSPATRTNDGYYISQKAAEDLLQTARLSGMVMPIDWDMSFFIKEAKIGTCHLSLPWLTQGCFKSSIQG